MRIPVPATYYFHSARAFRTLSPDIRLCMDGRAISQAPFAA